MVVAANYNCPGQLVISGETTAVEEACSKLKDAYITLQENLNISILCEYMCITYCVLVRNFAYAYVMLRMYFYGKHLNLLL